MKNKQVAQLDENGFFISMVDAELSPMESGVYLMPAGAVEAKQPKTPEGKRSRWTGSKWAHEDMPQPEIDDEQAEPYPEPEPDMSADLTQDEIAEALEKAGLLNDEQKARRKAAAQARKRFENQLQRRAERIAQRKAERQAARAAK
jgi:hypothetical protein